MKHLSAASFWEANQSPVAPKPLDDTALGEDITVDIAIIGGGFTGLSVAREIMRDEPSISVAVLESAYVGFGASGRNGGFNMSLFGLEPEVTLLRWGQQKTADAQIYMNKAVGYVKNLVQQYELDSDYEHNGMLRTAYSDRQLKRLEHSLELFEKLGVGHCYKYKTEVEIQANIRSPRFRAGVFEENSGILNPFKHVRELKRLAENAGARVYEKTPALSINRDGKYIDIATPKGRVRCKKLIIAANAWSGQIRGLSKIRSRQAPVWTSQVVSEVLSKEQWQSIGWSGRESIEDNRQLIHYFRRTACGRFTMGGGNVRFPPGKIMKTNGQLQTEKMWSDLKAHVKWLFPQLSGINFDYQWGGPVSVNVDMVPEIGFIGDERVIYAVGCMGHGVSLSQLNGCTIADLVLEKQTELTDFWIINRKAIPWPPGFIGTGIGQTIASGLRLWDKFEERSLDR